MSAQSLRDLTQTLSDCNTGTLEGPNDEVISQFSNSPDVFCSCDDLAH